MIPPVVCENDLNAEIVFEGVNGTSDYGFTYNVDGGLTQVINTAGFDSVSVQILTGTPGVSIYNLLSVVDMNTGCLTHLDIITPVNIVQLPSVFAGNDFQVCEGDSAILTGSGATTYVWDNNVMNGTAFGPYLTLDYIVLGYSPEGCYSSDTVTIEVVPTPEVVISVDNIYGCSPLTVAFTNASTGNLSNCIWSLGNGDLIEGCGNATTTYTEEGCYDISLIVNTVEGCSNQLFLSSYICVEPLPEASFEPIPSELTTYNWTSEMVNASFGASEYIWNFGDGTSGVSGVNPEHQFPNITEGSYLVTLLAFSEAGCVDTAYGMVHLSEELLFFVPNTFTPDGDSHNQLFSPVFTTGYDPFNYTMLIYNRWGELIFETHDVLYGWNGSYGNNQGGCQDGAYSWVVKFKRSTNDEIVEYVGHVNLIR